MSRVDAHGIDRKRVLLAQERIDMNGGRLALQQQGHFGCTPLPLERQMQGRHRSRILRAGQARNHTLRAPESALNRLKQGQPSGMAGLVAFRDEEPEGREQTGDLLLARLAAAADAMLRRASLQMSLSGGCAAASAT
jgi:hypothetical protein